MGGGFIYFFLASQFLPFGNAFCFRYDSTKQYVFIYGLISNEVEVYNCI